jgi:peptide/nickel transport system substrate-binding protein
MGFKVNFRVVPHDTMYTKFCQVPKSKAIICPNVGWFKDFSDPQAMLDATFNGNNILPVGNVNYQQFNDPATNAAMKAAGLIPPGAARNEAWAKVDKMVIAGAPAVPVIWDKTAILASKDVQQVPNTYTTTADLNFSYIK